MTIKNQTIKIKTKDFCQFIDLTDEVQEFISKSKVRNGIVHVYSKHTTVAIRVNEREKGLVKDFKKVVERLVPKDDYYYHNDLNVRTENLVCDPGASDCLNAHSHCLHLLMGSSETVPVVDGKLVLGQWQKVFVIELDCARNREIFIQVMGE